MKIWYTDLGKRLRKRLPHYSQRCTEKSTPSGFPIVGLITGVIVEDNFRCLALDHVEKLAVQIGSRPIGSKANLAAAEYIGGVFKQNGLSMEKQEISCPEWIAEQTSLELLGENLEASANTFSPSGDIAAVTVPVCTLAELELAAFRDKTLIFYGDMAQTELATKGGIYVSERDRRNPPTS